MSQAGLLQLAEQRNPTGQTFVVDESSTLTGIGIFFAKAPADDNYGITIEMRPTTEGGAPSSLRFVPHTFIGFRVRRITRIFNILFILYLYIRSNIAVIHFKIIKNFVFCIIAIYFHII